MSHLSTLMLNQLRYGELDPAAEAQARAHIQDCERCAGRLGAQEANRNAFVLEPVPEAIRRAAEREPDSRTSPMPANDNSAWRWVLMAVAAAVLVAFPLLLPPKEPASDNPYAQTRSKGEHILLEAWLDTREGPVLLDTDDVLHAGDVLQLKFSTMERPYVSFGGVDGHGVVELYGTIKADSELQILQAPFALQMDGTPGEQRFYALFTREQPSEAQIRQAILKHDVPDGGVLRTLHFEKE